MWLLLINCHLHEHCEYEFGCARTALARWPTFCFSKNSPMNAHSVKPSTQSLGVPLSARTDLSVPAADYPRAKQSADRNQLDAVVLTWSDFQISSTDCNFSPHRWRGGNKQSLRPADDCPSGASAVRSGAQVHPKRSLQVDRLRSPDSRHTHGGGNLP